MELLESSVVRPRQARYQAALRPDMKKGTFNSKALPDNTATPKRDAERQRIALDVIFDNV
jgi:hypothetical protein